MDQKFYKEWAKVVKYNPEKVDCIIEQAYKFGVSHGKTEGMATAIKLMNRNEE